MIFKKLFVKNRRGISLVEAMLAIATFALLTTAVIGGIIYGVQGAAISGQRLRAQALLAEGSEAVRSIRDSGNFTTFSSGTFKIIKSAGVWALAPIAVPATESEVIDSIFKRYVVIGAGTNSKKVTVYVSWDQGGISQDINASSLVTDWQDPGSSNKKGMLVYDEDGANNPSPHYRDWLDTDLSAELNMQPDETLTDEVNHTIIEASTTRDEYVRGALTSAGQLDVQVWNGTAWIDGAGSPVNGNFTTGIGTTNDIYRAFDIAYENVSGDAVVVYESTSTNNGDLKYRTWNGTTWSAEGTLTFSAVAGFEGNDVARWIECEADYGTDRIMCGWRVTTTLGVYASVWNGTTFIDTALISAENGLSTRQDFDVAWEGASGDGMIVYGDVVAAPFVASKTYIGNAWTVTTGMKDPGAAVQWLTIDSSPTHDYISVMVNDTASTSTADIGVEMWNGLNWTTVTDITDDSDINSNGYAQGQDVAWEKGGGDRALFVWRDGTTNENYIRYMVFDISDNAYQAIEDGTQCLITEGGLGYKEAVNSLSVPENAFGPCSAQGLVWEDTVSGIKLEADSKTNQIVLLAQDQTADLKPEMQIWNGDANGTWFAQTLTMGSFELDLSVGVTLSTSLPIMPYDFAFNFVNPIARAPFSDSKVAINWFSGAAALPKPFRNDKINHKLVML